MQAPVVNTQVGFRFGPKLIQAIAKFVGQNPSWHDHHRIRAIISSTTNNARKNAGRTHLPGQVLAYELRRGNCEAVAFFSLGHSPRTERNLKHVSREVTAEDSTDDTPPLLSSPVVEPRRRAPSSSPVVEPCRRLRD